MATSISAIEFYSGIGGWSCALKCAGIDATVVAAFDHSTVCNEVYHHNNKFRPSQKPIEGLHSRDLNGVANLWMMSPPCQPHTRQRVGLENQERDEDDPRARSFLHLCHLLEELTSPPSTIILENVIGFESSRCCAKWLAALCRKGYEVEQFHLCPRNFSYPNERPRYYMVARLAQPCEELRSDGARNALTLLTTLPQGKKRKLECEGESKGCSIASHLCLPAAYASEQISQSSSTRGYPSWLEPYAVGVATLEKDAAWCFDIVRCSDERSACFTRSYSRFVKGTGSVLFVPRTHESGALLLESGSAIDSAEDAEEAPAMPAWKAPVPAAEAEAAAEEGAEPPQAPRPETAEAASRQKCLGPDDLVSPEERTFGESWRRQVLDAGSCVHLFPILTYLSGMLLCCEGKFFFLSFFGLLMFDESIEHSDLFISSKGL
mmetsp:Transcript_15268/g.31395  ORF Transcript_15268/g.31395 Transcript_15268/m.31395 type:complete len:435 (+) Transcript_15268:271-1575(+)